MAQKDGFVGQVLKSIGFIKAKDKEKPIDPKAYSYSSQQLTTINSKLGIPKENVGIPFQVLRRIASVDPVVSNCVTIIKKEVSQCPYRIVKKPHIEKVNKDQVSKAYEFFQFINPDGENLRMLLDRVIEDVLILDAGAIELIYNYKDEVIGLNSVDGATIRLRTNKYGDMDDIAYVQYLEGQKVANFSKNEMIYLMMNPQNDVYKYPYGQAPVEKILGTVQANMLADLHNSNMFSSDNVPHGILNLGNIHEHDAEQIIALWNAQVIGNVNQLKFMYGPDKIDFLDFKRSNRDMQYVEYLDRLTRLILAAYGLSAIDLNIIQDINRSTAGAQTKLSNARGVQSMKQLIEEAINTRILPLLGLDTVMFQFHKDVSVDEQKTVAEVDEKYINLGVITAAEVRERLGYMEKKITPPDQMAPTPEDTTTEKSIKYPSLY